MNFISTVLSFFIGTKVRWLSLLDKHAFSIRTFIIFFSFLFLVFKVPGALTVFESSHATSRCSQQAWCQNQGSSVCSASCGQVKDGNYYSWVDSCNDPANCNPTTGTCKWCNYWRYCCTKCSPTDCTGSPYSVTVSCNPSDCTCSNNGYTYQCDSTCTKTGFCDADCNVMPGMRNRQCCRCRGSTTTTIDPPDGTVQGRVVDNTDPNNLQYFSKENDGCADVVDAALNVDHGVTNGVSWECNGGEPYYITTRTQQGQSMQLTFTPPAGYTCNEVSWKYSNCETGTCIEIANGTGCSAAISYVTSGNNIHLWWYLSNPNPFPTAKLVWPKTPLRNATFPEASDITVSVDIDDDTGGVQTPSKYGIYARKVHSDGTYASWCRINSGNCDATNLSRVSCSDSDCTEEASWNSVSRGKYQVKVDGEDDRGAWCSGSPDLVSGQQSCNIVGSSEDCDTDDLDCTTVVMDAPPTCSAPVSTTLTTNQGPEVPSTSFSKENQLMLIKFPSQDVDGQEVLNSLDVSCNPSQNSAFLSGSRAKLTIRARATQDSTNVADPWPRMLVNLVRPDGTRVKSHCTFDVQSVVFTNYNCDFTAGGQVASFEILFPNDSIAGPSSDKNLYIDYVLVYPDASQTSFYRIEGESTQVIYDKNVFSWQSPYDGIDVVTSINVIDGETVAYVHWTGALRFPVMWFAPCLPGSTCTFTNSPGVAVGIDGKSTCSIDLTSMGFEITGELKKLSDPNACDVASMSSTLPINSAKIEFFQNSSSSNTCGVSPIVDVDPSSSSYKTGSILFGDSIINRVCVTNFDDTEPLIAFDLACVRVRSSTGEVYTSTTGGVSGCYDFSTPLPVDSSNVVVDLGFKELGNDKWFVAQNGDIYTASDLLIDGAVSPVGNFFSSIINRANDLRVVGTKDFPTGNIITSRSTRPVVGSSQVDYVEPFPVQWGNHLQGLVYNIETASNQESKSNWLKSFNFSITSRPDITDLTSLDTIEAGKVYKSDFDTFQNLLNSDSQYTMSNQTGVGSQPSISVIYVGDSSDYDKTLVFSQDFINSANDGGDLVLVTPASVLISKDVGYDVTTPNLDENIRANIEAIIIAKEGIHVESIVETDPSQRDSKILFLEGSLIAGSDRAVSLKRNLGNVYNEQFPGTVVRYADDFLGKLFNLERRYSGVSSYTGLSDYTGVSDFNVVFVYD